MKSLVSLQEKLRYKLSKVNKDEILEVIMKVINEVKDLQDKLVLVEQSIGYLLMEREDMQEIVYKLIVHASSLYEHVKNESAAKISMISSYAYVLQYYGDTIIKEDEEEEDCQEITELEKLLIKKSLESFYNLAEEIVRIENSKKEIFWHSLPAILFGIIGSLKILYKTEGELFPPEKEKEIIQAFIELGSKLILIKNAEDISEETLSLYFKEGKDTPEECKIFNIVDSAFKELVLILVGMLFLQSEVKIVRGDE